MTQYLLKMLNNQFVGMFIPLSRSRFVIGRGSEAHLRINSSDISRKHCAIVISADGITIEDLGSRNGTFVNEAQISGPCAAQPGDIIRVGRIKCEVVVKSQDDASQSNVPEAHDEESITDWLSDAQPPTIRIEPQDLELAHVVLSDESKSRIDPEGARVPETRPLVNAAGRWNDALPDILTKLRHNHVYYSGTDGTCRQELVAKDSSTRRSLFEMFQLIVVFDCRAGIAARGDFDLGQFLKNNVRDVLAASMGFKYAEAYHQEQISQMIQDIGDRTCLFCFVDATLLGPQDQIRLREFTQSRYRVLFCGPNPHLDAKSSHGLTKTTKRLPPKIKPTETEDAASDVLRRFFNQR